MTAVAHLQLVKFTIGSQRISDSDSIRVIIQIKSKLTISMNRSSLAEATI